MGLTERELATRQNYDEKAYEWLNVSGGRDRPCFWQKEMDAFMSLLGKSKSVIELGCGPATDGKYLLESGCKSVVSIDYSSGMLKMARDVLQAAPQKPVLAQMDMYNLTFPKNTFDGFWATASFLHLENPWQAVREANRVLKPGGFGFLSIKEGEGEKVDPRTGYYFHYFSKFSFSSFGSILSTSGFNIVSSEVREAPNHNWLTYIVQKQVWKHTRTTQ